MSAAVTVVIALLVAYVAVTRHGVQCEAGATHREKQTVPR